MAEADKQDKEMIQFWQNELSYMQKELIKECYNKLVHLEIAWKYREINQLEFSKHYIYE